MLEWNYTSIQKTEEGEMSQIQGNWGYVLMQSTAYYGERSSIKTSKQLNNNKKNIIKV